MGTSGGLSTNGTGLLKRADEQSSRRQKAPRSEEQQNDNPQSEADQGPDTTGSVRLCFLGTRNKRATALLESFEAHHYQSKLVGSPDELEVGADESVIVVVDGDRQPDLVVTLRDIESFAPQAKVLVLAQFQSSEHFLTALYAGASGFCDSMASPEAVARSVEDLVNTGAAIPRSFASDLVHRLRQGPRHAVRGLAGPITLTDREWEVLSLLRRGRTTREIATALYVSPGTVRSHVWALVHKCGVDDRQGLVDLADAA
jgi:DNA-binding NarL/FixJ family response regulator